MNLSPVISYIVRLLVLVLILLGLIATPLAAASGGNALATASIAGEVYMDGNVNRIREPMEVGISGARVILLDASGSYLTETFTDTDGYYVFGNLEPAIYQVRVAPPAGYIVVYNSATIVNLGAVGAPLVISTALSYGLFVPLISR